MKELLKEFSDSNNYEYSEQDKAAYAYKKGYGIYVKQEKGYYIFRLLCGQELEGIFLGGTKIAGKEINVAYENEALTAKISLKDADNVLILSAISERLYAAANAAQLSTYCNDCRGNYRLNIVNEGGKFLVLCEDCRAKNREKEKSLAPQDDNIKIRKIDALGAFTAAIIGIIIYIVTYQVGVPTAVLGGVIGFAVSMGYQRAGGVFAKKGAWFCTSLCLMSIAIAEYFSVAVTLFLTNFWAKLGFWQALVAVPSFLSGVNAAGVLLKDLVGAFIVLFLTILWAYLRTKKRRR